MLCYYTFQNLRDEETYDNSNEMNVMEDNDDQIPFLASPPPGYKDIVNV